MNSLLTAYSATIYNYTISKPTQIQQHYVLSTLFFQTAEEPKQHQPPKPLKPHPKPTQLAATDPTERVPSLCKWLHGEQDVAIHYTVLRTYISVRYMPRYL